MLRLFTSSASGCHYVCSLVRSHGRTYARACFKHKPRKSRDVTKVSPLKKKIVSDIHDIFSRETVAVVHYGDLNTQAWNTLRLKLAETGMKIQVIPTKVATRALDDTHVQNITALFKGSTALVYGDFHQTNSLLTCIKSESKLCLLGGKVLNKLVTPQGLEEVAKLPSLEILHQELVALLCLPQRQTVTYLQNTPSALSQSLTLYTSPPPSSSAGTDA